MFPDGATPQQTILEPNPKSCSSLQIEARKLKPETRNPKPKTQFEAVLEFEHHHILAGASGKGAAGGAKGAGKGAEVVVGKEGRGGVATRVGLRVELRDLAISQVEYGTLETVKDRFWPCLAG